QIAVLLAVPCARRSGRERHSPNRRSPHKLAPKAEALSRCHLPIVSPCTLIVRSTTSGIIHTILRAKVTSAIMKPTRFELVILLLFASIVIYTDFVSPVVGMADSGDFERFFAQTGLFYVNTSYEDRYFNFLNLKYTIISKSPEDEPYRSSSAMAIRAARW